MTTPPGSPAERIRLVVSDVDGTLVRHDKTLAPRVVEAIGKLRAAGILFAVISSRPPRGLRYIIETAGIDTLVGGFNGGVVARPDLSVVAKQLVPAEAARKAVSIIRAHDVSVWWFTAEDWLITDPDGPHVEHERITVKFDPIVVESFPDEAATAGKIVGVSDDLPLMERVEKAVQEALGDTAIALRSQRYYLDINNNRANKGTGVEMIAARLGIPLSEVAVIGDMANDVPMFGVGGLSVAMGNAPADVQAKAHFVTATNAEDGFADAALKYFLPRAAGGK